MFQPGLLKLSLLPKLNNQSHNPPDQDGRAIYQILPCAFCAFSWLNEVHSQSPSTNRFNHDIRHLNFDIHSSFFIRAFDILLYPCSSVFIRG